MGEREYTANPDADATRGMTLRELVLEVRMDVKVMGQKFDAHLIDHAKSTGRHTGEAHILGIGRSALALGISITGVVASIVISLARAT